MKINRILMLFVKQQFILCVQSVLHIYLLEKLHYRLWNSSCFIRFWTESSYFPSSESKPSKLY